MDEVRAKRASTHLALVAMDQHRVISLVENRGERRNDLVVRDCTTGVVSRSSMRALLYGEEKDSLDTKGSLLPGMPYWNSLESDHGSAGVRRGQKLYA